MEWIRTARNPWGESVLLGLAWDVLWLVVGAGAVFVVLHAWFARKKAGAGTAAVASPAGVPAKVTRHGSSARISHWILAAATFALLITAFVPILGLQFPWVTIHWIAGIVFGAYVVYHTVETAKRGGWGVMWMGLAETREAVTRVKDFLAGREDPAKRPGKWGAENKVFHHLTALAGIAVLGTGLLMMARVDTWFWEANPYFLEIADSTWGWVFLLHGLSAVAFVGLLIAHIYFALRPDKLYLTKSMFRGWIPREEYVAHYDPAKWPVAEPRAEPLPAGQEAAGVGAGAGAGGSSTGAAGE